MGPNLHFLEMNKSLVEVDVHRYRYNGINIFSKSYKKLHFLNVLRFLCGSYTIKLTFTNQLLFYCQFLAIVPCNLGI